MQKAQGVKRSAALAHFPHIGNSRVQGRNHLQHARYKKATADGSLPFGRSLLHHLTVVMTPARCRAVRHAMPPVPGQVVTDFCSQHLERNRSAFASERLTLINDDARAQLEAAPDASFDVIIGDLADPLDGGPCYQLYTQVGKATRVWVHALTGFGRLAVGRKWGWTVIEGHEKHWARRGGL